MVWHTWYLRLALVLALPVGAVEIAECNASVCPARDASFVQKKHWRTRSGPAWPGSNAANSILVRNSCPFGVKAVDGAGNNWQVVTIPSGNAKVIKTDSCGSACRTHFVPDSWSGTPSQYGMGPLEPMGFFEYTKVGDGISPDISYIGGIGIPMTAQCAGDPLYGCTDGGYGGYDNFQKRLQDYCPGAVKTFQGSSVKFCDPGQYGGVADMPYGRKWDIQGSFSDSKNRMSQPNPQALAFCQPWSEGNKCPHVARGSSLCDGETVCDGEQEFYKGYDMRKVHDSSKWKFNGFAAFVHTICGVYAGFGFPADDRGVGMRNSKPMKYASNKGSGCRHAEIELCPAASSAFNPAGGFTYPPAAGGE